MRLNLAEAKSGKSSFVGADLMAVGADHIALLDLSPNLLGIVSRSPAHVEQLLCAFPVVKLQGNVVSVVAAVGAAVFDLVGPKLVTDCSGPGGHIFPVAVVVPLVRLWPIPLL